MRIFGYTKQDAETLQELSEVSIVVDRESAQCLLGLAQETIARLEKGIEEHEHLHLRDFRLGGEDASSDLIVVLEED